MRRGMRRLCALLLACALLNCGALAASYKAQVLTASMTVYASKGGSGKVLGSLDRGARFTVTSISGDWARISYKGRSGYAHMRNIIFDKRIPAVAVRDVKMVFGTKKSIKRGVYYRARLAAGTKVYVVGMAEGKLLITNASGSALGSVAEDALVKQ